jgi:DNA-binding response OmpR family regulator
VTQLVLVRTARLRRELRLLLEKAQVRCGGGGGRRGLARTRREPDVIISDVLMPEMDGYAFCAALKADSTLKEIPVLLVTILSGIDDIVRALECGADNVIRKPYEGGHLVSRIRYILANRELRELERTRMAMEVADGRRHPSAPSAGDAGSADLQRGEAVRLNKGCPRGRMNWSGPRSFSRGCTVSPRVSTARPANRK